MRDHLLSVIEVVEDDFHSKSTEALVSAGNLLEDPVTRDGGTTLYAKGVVDGLRCALLILDGATAEEATDYMAKAMALADDEDDT